MTTTKSLDAIKNHSQAEELRTDPQVLFEKRLGRVGKMRYDRPKGFETPLGHTYSILLEALAIKGLDATPQLQEFLTYIRDGLPRDFGPIHLFTPTYSNITRGVIRYARHNGLSNEAIVNILSEIIGPGEAREIRRRSSFGH